MMSRVQVANFVYRKKQKTTIIFCKFLTLFKGICMEREMVMKVKNKHRSRMDELPSELIFCKYDTITFSM